MQRPAARGVAPSPPVAFGIWCCGMLSLALGCVSIPERRFAMDRIDIRGTRALEEQDIEAHIATRESPRFLGVFRGIVYDYEVFDRYVLERDLQRIERYYRSRGFYWPRVRAGRVFSTGARRVRVEILVQEGPPTWIGRVDVHGVEGVSEEVAALAREAVAEHVARGERFEEQPFEDGAQALQRALADHGYAYAEVRRAADVDLTRQIASLGYWADTGPRLQLGEIEIRGLGPIPEDQIRRTLQLSTGSLYSRSELDSAQRAVLDLGVFSSVSVEPRGQRASAAEVEDTVPIRVRLQPSRFRSLRLGFGFQADSQRTELHLVGGWEDRNFLGGLRKMQVELVPGVVFWPTRVPEFEAPERPLPQTRLRLEFRQPGFLEALTHGLVRSEASVAPVLLATETDPDAPILGYVDWRAAVGVDRSLYWKLHAALTQNLQINYPFAYAGEIDPDLNTVLVSYPELFLRLDIRNDALNPRSGVYAKNSLQVAGLGGDARDVRVQPEVRGYIPLASDLTFVTRGTLGFLFAQNYGDTVLENVRSGDWTANRADWIRDVQLMFLRGFFSGGPGSNRGYSAREIGPHGAVPFYIPGQSTEETLAACDPSAQPGARDPSVSCELPLGGFSLWEASVELRFPLKGPLGGTVFLDASDVSPHELDVRLNYPHLSAGLGLRYATPVGPVRFDVGYRIPGLQAPASADEFVPREILGLPIAISLGIGEPL